MIEEKDCKEKEAAELKEKKNRKEWQKSKRGSRRQKRNNRKLKKKGTKMARRRERRRTGDDKVEDQGLSGEKSKHPRLDDDYPLDSDDAVVDNLQQRRRRHFKSG